MSSTEVRAHASRTADEVPVWVKDAEHIPVDGRVPFLHAYYHELVALRPRVFASWRPPADVRASLCGTAGAVAAGPTTYCVAVRAAETAEAAARASRALSTGVDWRVGDERDAKPRNTGHDARLAGELGALLAAVATELRGDGGVAARDAAARDAPDRAPLSALCFSGGGIRGAGFDLGVLQGLAHAGTLQRFDYLSSVAGGGHVAGWYQAWARRARRNRDAAGPVHALAAPRDAAGAGFDPLAPEPRPLERLRDFSGYLTPRRTLLSADAWAAAALVTRNLLLGWLVLLPVLAAVIGVPQLAYLVALLPASPARQAAGGALALASLALATISSINVHRFRTGALSAAGRVSPRADRAVGTSEARVVAWGLVPLYLSAMCLATAALWTPWAWPGTRAVGRPAAWMVWLVAAAWCVLAPVAGLVAARPRRRLVIELVAALAAGAVAAGLLTLLHRGVLPSLSARPALYALLAFPALLAAYLVARTLFVGFASVMEDHDLRAQMRAGPVAAPGGPEAGEDEWAAAAAPPMRRTVGEERSRDEHDREWWARLSAWVLLVAVGWLTVSALALLAGWLGERAAPAWSPAVLVTLAALAGATGLLVSTLGASGETSRGRRALLAVAAPACGVLVATALASANGALGRAVTGEPGLLCLGAGLHADSACVRPGPTGGAMWPTGREPAAVAALARGATPPAGDGWPRAVVPFAAMLGTLALVGVTMGAMVNVNRFSRHGLHRNRLVRAFLGASRTARQEDRFTGFSPRDDVRLHALWPRGALDDVVTPSGEKTYDALDAGARTARPMPIINAALDLAGGDQLAWRRRRTESFTFTPLYCGNAREGYRDARRYGGPAGIALGTAMSISGSAASPNVGWHASPAVRFVMSLFDARLGAWLGNTNEHGDRTFDRAGPRNALGPLVAELLGRAGAERGFVHLGDGGRFEGLGVYEVVLRRCRRVLACDAGGDVGHAVRRVRIDLGIPIEIGEHVAIPARGDGAALRCALGTIRYSEVDGTDPRDDGVLLYVTPAPRDAPRDAPRAAPPASPYEPTPDEWLDEARFERHRVLGRDVVGTLTGEATGLDVEALFARASRWVRAARGGDAVADVPVPLPVVPAADVALPELGRVASTEAPVADVAGDSDERGMVLPDDVASVGTRRSGGSTRASRSTRA